jgi:hypothetical protein
MNVAKAIAASWMLHESTMHLVIAPTSLSEAAESAHTQSGSPFSQRRIVSFDTHFVAHAAMANSGHTAIDRQGLKKIYREQ